MSLFDDDFYSASRTFGGSRWKIDGRRIYGRTATRHFDIRTIAAVVAIASGVALLVGWTLGLRSAGSVLSTEERIVRAVERVMPAVVSVVSSVTGGGASEGPSFAIGVGSGVVFEKAGGRARIITNQHVVQNASKVEVVLDDGTRQPATVLGGDVFTDLAVLETDGKNVRRVAEFGDSRNLRPGETAIAVGSPLGLGLSQSITIGVISGPQRRIPVSLDADGRYDWEMDVIQTDAAINVGNSGGALANLDGKVIGINSMKIAETGVEGLGFALPIHQVLPVVEELVRHGKVLRPKIGIRAVELDVYENRSALGLPESVREGLVVIGEVEEPAASAGLKAGDVIVELDGRPVGSMLELRQYLYGRKKIGDKLEITFYRNGKKETVTIRLGEY
ncbi:MAG: hypothetical protein BLM47_07290 [Candidatus Reconcilbacillus cellulovorans]|uniref:PDZ domain-containing protein n=1 Tax=Candidatus Reconcilbacillus cellulovorans TaxID=1906605 RepID=A0A2A6DZL4_9BACL|nr:MAG: hypothetical protein BLM47_07290 [Candidatus Reconcilbacillus cellulovorans]